MSYTVRGQVFFLIPLTVEFFTLLTAGCHGQGKISEKLNFFQVREKSGNFADGQGNLERTWKVREKSWNLKINGYGRQTLENLFIPFKKGKRCTFS